MTIAAPSTVKLFLLALLCLALVAVAAPGWAADAGGYDVATAHDPHFSDSAVWPEKCQVDKSAYAKETWPKARILIWAHTGSESKSLDPADPANWLEDGKPATEALDGNCDVVFPASETPYLVQQKKTPVQVRHITVDSGCTAICRMGHRGNTWIKKGGNYGGNGFGSGFCGGAKHTFMRNDTGRPAMLANGLEIAKAKAASVEFVGGPFGAYDDMMFDSGTCIVGPDSSILAGDRSTQALYPGSRLVLMSGAKFSKRAVMVGNNSDLLIGPEGALQAGTPERPLTRDCFVALSWKSRGRAQELVREMAVQKKLPEKFPVDWHIRHCFGLERSNDVGMVVLPEGRIEVHSADPKKARLVFHANCLPGDSAKFTEEMVKAIPHKIDVVFLNSPILSGGIEFRDVNKGGIRLSDPAVREKWTDVTFAQGNEGSPDALFQPLGGFKPNVNVQGHEDYAKKRMETNAIMSSGHEKQP